MSRCRKENEQEKHTFAVVRVVKRIREIQPVPWDCFSIGLAPRKKNRDPAGVEKECLEKKMTSRKNAWMRIAFGKARYGKQVLQPTVLEAGCGEHAGLLSRFNSRDDACNPPPFNTPLLLCIAQDC